jgi:CBS domain-containing protein
VRAALDTMKAEQVRRLPVVGQDGRLTGIVSIHDIAVEARPNKNSGLRAEDVLETFIAITAPQRERMIAS